VPAQVAILALAVPFDAQLLAGVRARQQSHRIFLRIGLFARTKRADVDPAEFVAGVAERGTGLEIDVQNGACFDIVDENRILRRIENRAIAGLRYAEGLVGALALGDVGRDGERHGIEGAAQASKFVAPLQVATRTEISLCELFGGADQSRGAASQ
jgi:hypothetical protein